MAEEETVLPSTEEKPEAPIHGDVLDLVLSHVPLLHLGPAYHVSKAWNSAVSSSLLHLNPIKPWLLVHTQNTRSPEIVTVHAYDPRSQVWIQISEPLIKYVSAVRSSHSTLLYMLSSVKLSFSFDPLHLEWHHAGAPRVCRIDPVVARVDNRVVVAGGVWDFEDDPLAVEAYNLKTGNWEACHSMPVTFKDSCSFACLSVAIDDKMVHVIQKHSGVACSFDPEINAWFGPYDIRPDQDVYSCAIATVKNDTVIMAGLLGEAENLKGVKLWEVNPKMGSGHCKEIGKMPPEMVKNLQGERWGGIVYSIAMNAMGDWVYIHNPSQPMELVGCKVVDDECREWRSVRNVAANDEARMGNIVISCSNLKMADLQGAMRSGSQVRGENFHYEKNSQKRNQFKHKL